MTTYKSKKKQLKKNKWALVGVICAALLFVAGVVALIVSLAGRNNQDETEKETYTFDSSTEIVCEGFEEINLGSDIVVTDVTSYAGMFVEDGSDEIVSGIPVATVENRGSDEVQLMNFTLTDEAGESYAFELTTLLPGARMTVLEKNKKTLDAEKKITSGKVESYAVFAETPSMHTDRVMLICEENRITVRNVGDKPLPTGRVFYKNAMGDLLIGGITYMVSFPELAPDEEITLTPGHFKDGNSRIVFVTYAE